MHAPCHAELSMSGYRTHAARFVDFISMSSPTTRGDGDDVGGPGLLVSISSQSSCAYAWSASAHSVAFLLLALV